MTRPVLPAHHDRVGLPAVVTTIWHGSLKFHIGRLGDKLASSVVLQPQPELSSRTEPGVRQ